MQTEEAKHQANKNTGSGESLGDKASHVGNVASNKVGAGVGVVLAALLCTLGSVFIATDHTDRQSCFVQAQETKNSAKSATEK